MHSKRQADLPQNVKWNIAVIPYGKPVMDIQDQPAYKFYRRNNQAADQHLEPYRGLPCENLIKQAAKDKAYASDNSHGPMTSASADKLNDHIDSTANKKKEEVFKKCL